MSLGAVRRGTIHCALCAPLTLRRERAHYAPPREHAKAFPLADVAAPEAKLQKIYARCQQLRNTSYEVERTEQEQKRAKEKESAT
jgi:hypothetical protein